MTEIDKLRALIWLLEEEAAALRSVLSEYEGDKYEYVQMVAADKFRAAIDSLRLPWISGKDGK